MENVGICQTNTRKFASAEEVFGKNYKYNKLNFCNASNINNIVFSEALRDIRKKTEHLAYFRSGNHFFLKGRCVCISPLQIPETVPCSQAAAIKLQIRAFIPCCQGALEMNMMIAHKATP